jgi:hypothetical protein
MTTCHPLYPRVEGDKPGCFEPLTSYLGHIGDEGLDVVYRRDDPSLALVHTELEGFVAFEHADVPRTMKPHIYTHTHIHTQMRRTHKHIKNIHE